MATTGAPCGRPGCGGTLDDGYCDTCGLAELATRASQAGQRVASPTFAPSPSARTGTSPSGRTPSTRSARSTRSTRSTRSGSTRSGRTARALGGLALPRPPLPPQDPLAVLIAPEVPDRKRYCSSCDAKLNREGGFCPKCGQPYSFKPTLAPGDMVDGKYEVKGTIAFGGLGWIYLALDTVLSRWVVLKGLLNAKDPKMIEVAVKEREFLAAVKHPNVVGIYDFVSQGDQGFIVMEFVNGKTLMRLRRENGGPLPVAEAIAYVVEILPALGYLDEMGLVYCDFKPENAMVEEDTVKLIDLGAVRTADDATSDVYGSKGYIAPEAHDAPSALSDLYSVARALAVLVADFDFQGKYERTLPPASEVPVFAQNEALYRLLLKATRAVPQTRFESATEMAEQLVGVLRHVQGAGEVPRIDSAVFEADGDGGAEIGDPKAHDGIPRLRVDREDRAASVVLAASAIADPERRLQLLERALLQHPTSAELALFRADELVTLGRHADAASALAQGIPQRVPGWRSGWVRGRGLLAQDRTKDALDAFQSILAEMPGELAPQQAVARVLEVGGHLDEAKRLYDAVSRADPSFTSAAFGLARCCERLGDRDGAIEAYRRVPSTGGSYVQAQTALARALLRPDPKSGVVLADIKAASDALEAIAGRTEGIALHQLRSEVFVAAARVDRGAAAGDVRVLGLPLKVKVLRRAAEEELRACARMAGVEAERIRWVDEANRVRPVTWV